MGYQRNEYRGELRDRERGFGRRYGPDYDDDRGFFDRAGDEVRSWFGDDEAERRREIDLRRYEREQGIRGDVRGPGYRRESGRDYDVTGGRRFDSIDAGLTSTVGADPAASGGVFGFGDLGYGGDYGRSRAIYESSGRTRPRGYDPHYAEWRSRQIDTLDRDYEDYRREHQARFDQEFGNWRERRQGQRQSLGRIAEHMEVVGSDGGHIGKVDCVKGDRIILTRSDSDAGGHHHSIPCGWIESVDKKVTIDKSAEQAKQAWRDEEESRAFFDRDETIEQRTPGRRTQRA